MLEQGFSFLLKKFLGEFVEDGSIIQENLQVAAWSGCIILEQLVLKKEALSLLNVPLALTHGSIGRIEIQIPWASLGVDPVIISIEKICLLLEPKYEWNPDSRENKEHALKQAKLAALELFAKRRAQPSDDPWKGYKDFAQKWLLESVVSKIVDKVQVTVSDIHIRYEDHVSCPSSFSVGLTLERVQAKSRDELDEDEDELLNDPEPPTAIDDKATPQESSLMKVVELRQLSVYWNPLTHSGIAATTSTFTGRGRSEIQTLMLRTIARGSEYKDRPKHHYILLPTDITITMAAAIDPAKKTASGNVQIAISDIGISFEDRQFREAVSLGTNMSNFMQLEKFSGYRPQVPVHHDPAAWWRYAVKAVMFQMHAERRSLSWRQISDRSLDKDVYIELWKYKLCTPTGVLNAALTAAAKMKAAPTKTCSSSPRSTEEQAAAPSLAGTKGRNVSAEKLAYRSQALFSELLAESRARRKSLRERLPGRSFRPPSIPVLNADTAALLMALERKLTFEDIVYFRSLAEKELAESGTSVNRQGWMDGALSWATGGLFGSASEEDKGGKTFFDALLRDPENIFSSSSFLNADSNTVVAVASVTLVKGSITLALSTPTPMNSLASGSVAAISLPFLEIGIAGLQMDASVYGDGSRVKAYVSLQDIEMFELSSDEVNGQQKNRLMSRRLAIAGMKRRPGRGYSSGSLSGTTGGNLSARRGFKDPYQYAYAPTAERRGGGGGTPTVALGLAPSYHSFQEKRGSGVFGGSATVRVDSKARPLFSASVELLPSTYAHDAICSVVLEELEVLISPTAKWVDSLITFATWPEDLEFWSEMEMTAMNQLADFKSKVDAKLEYMMNNHKKILIEARINAPVMIISSAGASDLIVMDLGQITVVTERLAKLEHEKSMVEQSMLTTQSRDVSRIAAHSTLSPTTTLRSRSPRVTIAALDVLEKTVSFDDNDNDGDNNFETPPSERSLSPIPLSEGEESGGTENDYKQCLDVGDLTGAPSDLDEVRSRYEKRQSLVHLPPGSDPAPSAQSHTLGQSCNQSITSDYEGSDDKFFDLFKVQVSHIEVFMIRADDWTGHVESEGSARKKLAIVDKFNVNMSILLCVLTWDMSLPTMKVEVDLSEINVRLSEDRLVRLALFGASIAASAKAIVAVGRDKAKKYEQAKKGRGSIKSQHSKQSSKSNVFSRTGKAQRSARSSITSLPASDVVGDALEGALSGYPIDGEDGEDDDDDVFFDALSDYGDVVQTPPTAPSKAAAGLGLSPSQSVRSGKSRTRSSSSGKSPRGILSSIPGTLSLPRSSRVSGKSTPATRSVLGDDDEGSDAESVDSDDSFLSVEGDMMPSTFEAARRAEELQFSIRHREAVRNKLMGEIRKVEAEASKKALLNALQEELAECEAELHQLKIAYVEALMVADESKLNRIRENPEELGDAAAGVEGLVQYLDALIGSKADGVDVETAFDQRRTFMRTTVFKSRPKRTRLGGARGGVGGNKELVFMELKIAQVGIMFIQPKLASSPSSTWTLGEGAANIGAVGGGVPESPSREIDGDLLSDVDPVYGSGLERNSEVVIHTILSGIGLKAKHRALDSKVTLSVSDLEVKDAIAGRVAAEVLGVPPSAPMCVISSDPSCLGLDQHPSVSNNFTQLLRVKYAIVYGQDNYYDDLLEDEPPTSTPSKHDLSVKAGYLGVSIEQETVAALLRTANSIVTAIKPTLKALVSDEETVEEGTQQGDVSSQPPRPTKPLQLPLIMLRFNCRGGSIALLHRARPLVSASSWDLQANMESRETWLKFWLRLMDASVDHHVDLPATESKFGHSHNSAFMPAGSTPVPNLYAFSPLKVHDTRVIRDGGAIYPSQFPSTRYIVAGRQSTSEDPSVHISFQIEIVDQRPVVRGGVNVAPQQLVVVPSFLASLAGALVEGALVRESVSLTKSLEDSQPQRRPTSTRRSPSVEVAVRSPLEDVLALFKTTGVGGYIDIKINDLIIATPTEYPADAAKHSPRPPTNSRTPQHHQQQQQRQQQQAFSFIVQEGITANVVFGEACAFGGVELVSVIAGANVRLSDLQVVDPFDVCTRVGIYLPGSHVKEGMKQLEFDRPFGPKDYVGEVADNQVRLSVGVSPVVTHISEGVLYEAGTWVAANEIHFKSISDAAASASAKTSSERQSQPQREEHVATVNDAERLPNIGFNVTTNILMYEIGTSLDAYSISPSTSGSFNGLSDRMKMEGQHIQPSLSGAMFYFSVRNVVVDTIVGPEQHIIDTNILTASGVEASSRPRSQSSTCTRGDRFAVTTFSIQSVDFEHLVEGSAALRRLLATVNRPTVTTAPSAAPSMAKGFAANTVPAFGNEADVDLGPGAEGLEHSQSGLLPQLRRMDSFDFEGDAAVKAENNLNKITSPALSCRVLVTDTYHVTVNADVAHMQLVVIPSAMIRLANMGVALQQSLLEGYTFQDAATSPSLASSSAPLKPSRRTSFGDVSPAAAGSQSSSEHTPKNDNQSSFSDQLIPRAQPLSVPLSSVGPSASTAKASSESRPTKPLPTVNLTKYSFALPKPFRGLSFSFTLRSCGIWIPSDETKLSATALHTSLSADGHVSFHSVAWTRLEAAANPTMPFFSHSSFGSGHERPATDDEATVREGFFAMKFGVSDVHMYLSPVKYGEIYTPLEPLSSPTPAFIAPAANLSRAQKHLLLPFGAQIAFVTSVVARPECETNHRHPDSASLAIEHRVEVHCQEIEVLAPMDYRPFVKVHKNTIQPLVDFGESLLLALSQSQASGTAAAAAQSSVRQPTQNTMSPRPDRPDIAAVGGVSNNDVSEELTTKTPSNVFDLLVLSPDVGKLTLELHQDGITVFFVNDLYNQPVTVARSIVSSVSALVVVDAPVRQSASTPPPTASQIHDAISCSRIRAEARVTVAVEYHNQTLLVWEPLVEPFEVCVTAALPHSALSGNVIGGPVVWHLSHLSQRSTPVSQTNLDDSVAPTPDVSHAVKRRRQPQVRKLSNQMRASDAPIRDAVAAVTDALNTVTNTVSNAMATVASTSMLSTAVADIRQDVPIATTAVAAPPITAQIHIRQPINVNFTMGLLQTISSIAVSAQVLSESGTLEADASSSSFADRTQNDGSEEKKSADLSVMVIRNDSGLMLQYWQGDESRAVDVAPNSERALSLADMEAIHGVSGKADMNGGPSSGPISGAGARSVSITLWHPSDDYPLLPLRDVPLDGSGCRLFLLDFVDRVDTLPATSKLELRKSQSEAMPAVNTGAPLRLAKQLSYHPSGGSQKAPLNSDTPRSAGSRGSSGKSSGYEPMPPLLTPKGIFIAAELTSKGGVRTLTIRSTLNFVNSSTAPVRIQLLSLAIAQRMVLWEAIVSAGSSLPLPAHLCNIPNTRIAFQPLLSNKASNIIWSGSRVAGAVPPVNPVEVGIPSIPGAVSASGTILHEEVDMSEEEHSEDEFGYTSAHGRGGQPEKVLEAMRRSATNKVRRRKLFAQSRDGVDTISYSHWLDLCTADSMNIAAENNTRAGGNAIIPSSPSVSGIRSPSVRTDIFCNVDVVSTGAPRTQNRSTKSSSMSRVFTVRCPVTTVNLLACDVDVLIVGEKKKRRHGYNYGANGAPFVLTPSSARELAFALTNGTQYDSQAGSPLARSCLVSLKSGESTGLMAFHATDKLSIAIRLDNPHTRDQDSWSSVVMVAGCGSHSTGESTRTFDVKFANGSVLEVLMDLSESNGVRTLKFYVPYWIVSSSVLPLLFQHDPALANAYAEHCAEENIPVKDINGVDGLAADQVYVQKRQDRGIKSVFGSWFSSAKGTENNALDNDLTRGLGKARGIDGVVLGPETPIRGLADILSPSAADDTSSARRVRWGQREADIKKRSNRTSADYRKPAGRVSDVSPDIPYRLMQCGYSNSDMTGRVRMRATGTKWSHMFSLDSVNSVVALDVKSIKGYFDGAEESSVTAALKNEPLRSGRQVFSFGVFTTKAEPPFTKTKVIVVVDRFLLINGLGKPMEVRQVGCEDVITVDPQKQQPMWWRPGDQAIQVRLPGEGSLWSGRLQVRTDGETTVRLRSEEGKSVYFLSVSIVKQGPRICIVFKSAEGFVPYRIENHTLQTFRIRQKTTAALGGNSNFTPVLPYHACPYAWDEPTASRLMVLDVVKAIAPSTRSRSPTKKTVEVEEMRVGVFNLDNIEKYNVKDNLVIRVHTDGPVRVLQILDRRSSVSPVNGLSDSLGSGLKPAKLHLMLNVAAFGVSVIDQTPQELLYLSVSDVSINHIMFDGEDCTTLSVDRVQVDNQLWSSPYPCLFYPLRPAATANTDTDNTSTENADPYKPSVNAFFQLEVKRNKAYVGVEYLSLLRITVLPFDVNMEGTIIKRMLRMGYAAMDLFAPLMKTDPSIHSQRQMKASQSKSAAPPSSLPVADGQSGRPSLALAARNNNLQVIIDEPAEADGISRVNVIVQTALTRTAPAADITEPVSKVYIQALEVSEMRINLSFNPLVVPSAEAVPDFEGDGGLGSFGQSYPGTSSSLLLGALATLLKAIGSTLAKIDNCPLRFQSYAMSHAFLNATDLAIMMGSHYGTQFVGQTYLILGSSDALGNPVKFFKTLGEGVWDFLYLPVIGLMTSPAAFGEGILRGSSSLIRRAIASFCNTASTMAGSMQVGLVTLGVVESPYLLLARAEAAAEEANYRLLTSDSGISAEEKESAAALVTARDAVKFRRPAGFREGLKVAFIGAFSEPLAALRTDTNSLRALLVGSAKGTLGLFARPIFGLLGSWSRKLDYVSYKLLPRIEGVEKHRMKRNRPPRFFHSPTVPLQVYKAEENAGLELLARINMGRYKSEGYEWHCRIGGSVIVVMTPVRLMVVSDSFEFCELHWQCLLSQILFLEIDLDRHAAASASSTGAASLVSDAMKVKSGNRSFDRLDEMNSSSIVRTVTEEEMLHPSNILSGRRNAREDEGPQDRARILTEEDLRRRLRALQGAPVLHVYHLPTNMQSQRAVAIQRPDGMANGKGTTTPRTQLNSGSGAATGTGAAASGSEGARLSHRQLGAVNHEQLVELLGHLLRRVPSLASDEVLRYLTYCGVPLPQSKSQGSLDSRTKAENFIAVPASSSPPASTATATAASAAVFAGQVDYEKGVISLRRATPIITLPSTST